MSLVIKNLFQDLNIFYLTNFEKYCLSNPLFNISPDGSILTWHNYKTKEYFYTYEEYYQWINDNLQYSICIDDGMLIQIFFTSDAEEIKRASLTFLPRPDSLMSYFRFDMDFENSKNYYHNSYHINFGYNSDNVRFTLHRFPYPSEFMRFALFLLGRDEFKQFERKRFFSDLRDIGEEYSHFFDFSLL